MANLVSEWFFRHRFITRHHIRKSSMRICFILPKQVNSNVYYFFSSVKEKFFWMPSLDKHVSFRSIDSMYFHQIDIFIKTTKLHQYFHYKKMFFILAVCLLRWIPQPDTLFSTQHWCGLQEQTEANSAASPVHDPTHCQEHWPMMSWPRLDSVSVALWVWRSTCPLAFLKTRSMWPLFTLVLTVLLRQSWILQLKGCSSCSLWVLCLSE